MEKNEVTPVTEVKEVPQKGGSLVVKILVIILFLLVIVIVGIVAYFMGSSQAEVSNAPTPVVTPTPTPTLTPAPTILLPTATPTPKLNTNPNLKTFTSDSLKISFNYLETQPDNPKDKIATRVIGNKVFVNFASYSTDGQSVEVFKKDKSESVAEAIKRLFLNGISDKDCIVKETTDSKKYPQNFTTWVIAYPTDPNSDIPEFAQENKCPVGYTQTNGIAYFLGDVSHPDQFLFLSIGQYGLYADSGKMWQETIKFL